MSLNHNTTNFIIDNFRRRILAKENQIDTQKNIFLYLPSEEQDILVNSMVQKVSLKATKIANPFVKLHKYYSISKATNKMVQISGIKTIFNNSLTNSIFFYLDF